jgi:hypothetical protein
MSTVGGWNPPSSHRHKQIAPKLSHELLKGSTHDILVLVLMIWRWQPKLHAIPLCTTQYSQPMGGRLTSASPLTFHAEKKGTHSSCRSEHGQHHGSTQPQGKSTHRDHNRRSTLQPKGTMIWEVNDSATMGKYTAANGESTQHKMTPPPLKRARENLLSSLHKLE